MTVNSVVAVKICRDLGLTDGNGEVPVLTGQQVEALDDDTLTAAAATSVVFARVSPEQKARIVRLLRALHGVGYLGDRVNDALALHQADVAISVDTGTDVAKDAADVIPLEKDLGDLARGVTGGRRIFANTIKYVLMGTSSNFGNMFSAAASAFLSFLPMLPQQILLTTSSTTAPSWPLPPTGPTRSSCANPRTGTWDRSPELDTVDLGMERKVAFVLGAEGPGLKPATLRVVDEHVVTPMAEEVDSLNVAAARTVVFWQRRAAPDPLLLTVRDGRELSAVPQETLGPL